MAMNVRVEVVGRDIAATVRSDLSPTERGKAIAAYVKEGIDAGDQTNRRVLGRVPPRTITVDGRQGGAIESVNSNGGSIIVEWELVADVLIWIGHTLQDRSPVTSGRYRRAHQLFADGVLVEIGADVPLASEYLFTNDEPYARKIEIGKTRAGRNFVVQVENRIYERTARDARARFGNIAKITFTYQSVNGGAIGAWASSRSALGHARRHKRKRNIAEWLTNQPAITVALGKQ